MRACLFRAAVVLCSALAWCSSGAQAAVVLTDTSSGLVAHEWVSQNSTSVDYLMSQLGSVPTYHPSPQVTEIASQPFVNYSLLAPAGQQYVVNAPAGMQVTIGLNMIYDDGSNAFTSASLGTGSVGGQVFQVSNASINTSGRALQMSGTYTFTSTGTPFSFSSIDFSVNSTALSPSNFVTRTLTPLTGSAYVSFQVPSGVDPGALTSVQTVPEPSSVVLLLAVGLVFSGRAILRKMTGRDAEGTRARGW